MTPLAGPSLLNGADLAWFVQRRLSNSQTTTKKSSLWDIKSPKGDILSNTGLGISK